LSLVARVRIGKRCPEPARATAILGIFAILFQAMLFAWHHHAPPFASPSAPGVVLLAATSGEDIPAAADHNCQVCLYISQHGAAPVDFFTGGSPGRAALPSAAAIAADPPLAAYLLFRSRAPPQS
jgi:hypothetical protein